MYRPSMVLNTWVEVDRDTAHAFSEGTGLDEGDKIFFVYGDMHLIILFCDFLFELMSQAVPSIFISVHTAAK